MLLERFCRGMNGGFKNRYYEFTAGAKITTARCRLRHVLEMLCTDRFEVRLCVWMRNKQILLFTTYTRPQTNSRSAVVKSKRKTEKKWLKPVLLNYQENYIGLIRLKQDWEKKIFYPRFKMFYSRPFLELECKIQIYR